MNIRLQFPKYDGIAEAVRSRRRSRVSDLRKLLFGEPKVVEGIRCGVPQCEKTQASVFSRELTTVYYPGLVHHLDGDFSNNSATNLAMVCPECGAHILLSRFSTEDIQRMKAQGMDNAEIGRQLGISRERVRQIVDRLLPDTSRQPSIAGKSDS